MGTKEEKFLFLSQFNHFPSWVQLPLFKEHCLEHLSCSSEKKEFLTFSKKLLENGDDQGAIAVLESCSKFDWPETLRYPFTTIFKSMAFIQEYLQDYWWIWILKKLWLMLRNRLPLETQFLLPYKPPFLIYTPPLLLKRWLSPGSKALEAWSARLTPCLPTMPQSRNQSSSLVLSPSSLVTIICLLFPPTY